MGEEPVQGRAVLEPGSMVGHFKVVRLAGRGGMGEVYLARDTKLGRKVALKLVLPQVLGNAQAVARFLEEARTTARFSHPHIVTVYAAGETQVSAAAGGDRAAATPPAATMSCPYVALEFLDGQTLRERIQEKLPSPMETARLGLAIAQALAEAHRHGVLHRDLKPENVMIPADGRLRVLDFGLAKTIDAGAVLAAADTADLDAMGRTGTLRASIASAGALMGTPMYMAPEQWTGLEPTAAIDVWALGMVLHELLAGQHPFEEFALGGRKKLFALAAKVCGEAPVPALKPSRSTPASLVGLVERCVAKAPDARPKAAEVASELERLLGRGQIRLDEDESPFRGLLPFTSDQAALFFGRDAEIAQVLERLRAECVLPVVGPSGAGKSSFVLAGLVPRLRETGRWIVLEMRPGRQPFKALAASIARARRSGLSTSGSELGSHTGVSSPKVADGGEDEDLAGELAGSPALVGLHLGELAARHDAAVLLVVDQLEELHTLVSDEAERRAFLAAVCSAADDRAAPVRVIFTLRDDFLGKIAEGPSAREALGHVVVLRSPEPEALREVLEKPAQAVGYSFEEATIVEEMVAAVRGEAAALALLQLAAEELWERRDRERRLLTRESFDAMGGIEGALAKRADRVLEGLSPAEVQTARLLLLRLVTAEGTRRTVPRSDLLEGVGEESSAILERLVQGRLVLTRKRDEGGEAEIELVHESLLRAWRRLARWIEESREDLAALAEVGEAARLWHKRGCRADEVWQGRTLADALRKLERVAEPIPEASRKFLDASEARDKRRVGLRRRLYGSLVGVLVLVAAGAIAAAAFLGHKERLVSEQRDLAQAREAAALREAAKLAFGQGSVAEARAKVRMALTAGDDVEARGLWWHLQREPLVWERKEPGNALFAWRPGASVLFTQDAGVPISVNVETQELAYVAGALPGAADFSFTARGDRLAVTNGDANVTLVDLDGHAAARILEGRLADPHTGGARYGPEGRWLAMARPAEGDERRTIAIVDAAGGKLERELVEDKSSITRVAVAPLGEVLASARADGSVGIWEVSAGKKRYSIATAQGQINALAFSPDGRMLATSGTDAVVRFWDVGTGSLVRETSPQPDVVNDVAFHPDGSMIAVATADGSLRLWDAATARERALVASYSAPVWSVAFDGTGKYLAAGAADGSRRVWDLKLALGQKVTGRSARAIAGADSRGRDLLATGDADGEIWLWDSATGEPRVALHGHNARIASLAISPDGRTLLSGDYAGVLRSWKLPWGTASGVVQPGTDWIPALAFAPDGKLAAVAASDKILLYSVASHGLVRELSTGGHIATGMAFSVDGTTLAAALEGGAIQLWDVHTGKPTDELRCDGAGARRVAYSPDGALLAWGDGTGSVWTRDLAQGKQRKIGNIESTDAAIRDLSFDPDGKRLLASAGDWISAWDTQTGEQLVRLRPLAPSGFARFSSDGSRVLSASASSLYAWDARTGAALWQTAVVLPDPPLIFTRSRWRSLDSTEAPKLPDTRWRSVLEAPGTSASAPEEGDLLCLLDKDGRLEIWDRAKDERLSRDDSRRASDVLALPDGCVAQSKWPESPGIRLYSRAGVVKTLSPTPLPYDVHGREIYLARPNEVAVFDVQGSQIATYSVGGAVGAMLRTPDFLAVGRLDGSIELRAATGDQSTPVRSLHDTPSGAANVLCAGPAGTLLGGYLGGEVAVWDLRSGARLLSAKLNGLVPYMLVRGNTVYATSIVGDYTKLDLSVLTTPYCDLLREVWSGVPYVSRQGGLVVEAPPADHPCAQR